MLRCQSCDCLKSLRGTSAEVESRGENVVLGEKGKDCSWKVLLTYREDSDLDSTHSPKKSVRGLGLFDSQSVSESWCKQGKQSRAPTLRLFPFETPTPFSRSQPQALLVYLHLFHNLHPPIYTMDDPKTTHAAANMLPGPPNQSPSLAGAQDSDQQTAGAAPDNNGEHAASHGDSTPHSSPLEASSTSQAATGDKRQRGDDAGEPGEGIKKPKITLPLLFSRLAIAPPSYQEQQVLIDSGVQPSKAELSESHEPNSSPSEDQNMSEMQLDATEGQEFLGALFTVVSMNRLLGQRWELYEDSRGKYERRCHIVESFETGLKELEKKKHSTTVNPKHLNEIVEHRRQISKFTPDLEMSKEETDKLINEYDGLHDEVDAGIEAVLAYDESLKDDEALQFLTVRTTFWKIFKEIKDAASAAANSAEAKHREIEEERASIRNRIGGHYKQNLIERLANPDAINRSHSATACMEHDVRRLSVLMVEQRNLENKEKFEVLNTLRSLAGKLLKIAEQAFVDAELLRPDDNHSF